MNGFLDVVLLVLTVALALPVGVLLIECGVAFVSRQENPKGQHLPESQTSETKVSVLIPAHDEALQIQGTLEGLLPQVQRSEQIVVVADNCSDETAAIARQLGVTVLERQNLEQRGKGYALDYGLEFLARNSSAGPPNVLVMVDADCRVEPGTVSRIAQLAQDSQRPVQALYLMETPANPSSKDSISALAFLVKNQVRPQGLLHLGVPCALTGTGMAFPWVSLQGISLASGNIVEDMQLGIDLAIAGFPPLFCPEAMVIGILPQQEQAATRQRTRWEHGHLQLILGQAPRLIQAAIQQRRWDLLAMALDLSVPPLSLLVMLWLGVTALTGLALFFGMAWQPFVLSVIEGGLLLLAVALAWLKFGQDQVPLKTLLSIPGYILWKIPLYFAFLFKRQQEWVRTDRDST
ncbi:MAG: glycosyltransferase [Oscillatoriales cyanobacterium RM2_1_1]|nr:glycosyltransferase [Oscillatoriales cyanobacterium SM2_3_0]NJO45529.1 glycosyltransferase [Oscillatoriales cyanobacterium RM2_1_1]